MAVTLTQVQLSAALRLGSTAEENAEATRLLGYATTAVTKYAPNAPDDVHDEAVVRLAGYLFDQPTASTRSGYANALRNSGATAILLPYRTHRAGKVDAAEAAPDGMQGSPGNPVTNVTVAGSVLTVVYADGTTATRDLPAGGGVDQVARNAAAASQASADANSGFLSTFMARVQAVVESIVPAWARMPSPPSGSAGAVADGAVTTAKLADDAVTGRKLAGGSVASGHLVDAAVTNAKIENNAVTGRKIAADSIERGHMRDDSVGTTELVDGGVTEGKLAAAVRTKLNSRGSEAAATLTTAQLIDLLQFDVVPGVIVGYSTDGQVADWLTDWRVWVSGGSTVGDVWVAMQIEGLSTLAAPAPTTPGASLNRHKLSATNIYNYTFSNLNRDNLISGRTTRRQGRDIEVDLIFYDAASAGNEIDRKTLAVDWLAAPAASEGSGGGSPSLWTAGTPKVLGDNLTFTSPGRSTLALTTGQSTEHDWLMVSYVGWRLNGRRVPTRGIAIYNLQDARLHEVSILGYSEGNTRVFRFGGLITGRDGNRPAYLEIVRHATTQAETAQVRLRGTGFVGDQLRLPAGTSITLTKLTTTTAMQHALLHSIASDGSDLVPEVGGGALVISPIAKRTDLRQNEILGNGAFFRITDVAIPKSGFLYFSIAGHNGSISGNEILQGPSLVEASTIAENSRGRGHGMHLIADVPGATVNFDGIQFQEYAFYAGRDSEDRLLLAKAGGNASQRTPTTDLRTIEIRHIR